MNWMMDLNVNLVVYVNVSKSEKIKILILFGLFFLNKPTFSINNNVQLGTNLINKLNLKQSK